MLLHKQLVDELVIKSQKRNHALKEKNIINYKDTITLPYQSRLHAIMQLQSIVLQNLVFFIMLYTFVYNCFLLYLQAVP